MTPFFIFLAQGFAVLLLTAMVVAAWEQWRASQMVWSSIHGGTRNGPMEPLPTHADAAGAALARMTRPGALTASAAPAPTRRNDPSWAETRPMIGGNGSQPASPQQVDLPLG